MELSRQIANFLKDKPCRVFTSPYTASHDQVRKLDLYERKGIVEYWIVHPADRIVTIFSRDKDGAFARPRFVEAHGTLPVGILPDLEKFLVPMLPRGNAYQTTNVETGHNRFTNPPPPGQAGAHSPSRSTHSTCGWRSLKYARSVILAAEGTSDLVMSHYCYVQRITCGNMI